MRLIYDEGAYEDGAEAAFWYGQQGADLRDRFLSAWKAAAMRVVASPEIYRCFKRRFEEVPF